MIHKVCLPELTLKRLTDVVVLQIWLLFYAVSRQTLDQADCANRLNRCPRFRGRGEKIAKWVWQAPDGRLKLLQEIATDPTSSTKKRKWFKQLAYEVFRLLKQNISEFKPVEIREPWQKAAKKFLINFYEEVFRQTPTPRQKNVGFPLYIFSGNNPSYFGAKEFLTAFKDENKDLSICPACDINPIGQIENVDIDHYLPKSKYPHLACHPYNLVPNCLFCNQRIKKGQDPLTRNTQDTRRRVEDIFMPYWEREPGLGKQTSLEILLSKHCYSGKLGQLKPIAGLSLGEKIEAFQETYKIPDDCWSERINSIEELLFKDLQYFLNTHSVSFKDPQIIDWLDYHLYKPLFDDWGKKPDRVVMAWLLIAHIHEAIPIFINDSSPPIKLTPPPIKLTPLLQELQRRCEQQEKLHSSQLSKQSVRKCIEKARNFRQKVR